MDVKNHRIDSTPAAPVQPYATPCLTILGAVTELTASGSFGNPEPGCTTDCVQRRPA